MIERDRDRSRWTEEERDWQSERRCLTETEEGGSRDRKIEEETEIEVCAEANIGR